MGHNQNFTDTIWIVGPLGQAIRLQQRIQTNCQKISVLAKIIQKKTCQIALFFSMLATIFFIRSNTYLVTRALTILPIRILSVFVFFPKMNQIN